MKKILLILIFSLFLVSLYAQKRDVHELKRWCAGLSAGIVPIPPNALSLQPGIEFFITPQVSLLNEIALQLGKNNHADSFALNKKFFKYKAELRYYFSSGKLVTPYTAFQFAIAKRQFTIAKHGHFYENTFNDSAYYFDKAAVNSPIAVYAAQFGLTFSIIKSLSFDFYTGAGYRLTDTEYSETENLQKDRRPSGLFYIKPVSSYYYSGKRTALQLNLGGRLFYRF